MFLFNTVVILCNQNLIVYTWDRTMRYWVSLMFCVCKLTSMFKSKITSKQVLHGILNNNFKTKHVTYVPISKSELYKYNIENQFMNTF